MTSSKLKFKCCSNLFFYKTLQIKLWAVHLGERLVTSRLDVIDDRVIHTPRGNSHLASCLYFLFLNLTASVPHQLKATQWLVVWYDDSLGSDQLWCIYHLIWSSFRPRQMDIPSWYISSDIIDIKTSYSRQGSYKSAFRYDWFWTNLKIRTV